MASTNYRIWCPHHFMLRADTLYYYSDLTLSQIFFKSSAAFKWQLLFHWFRVFSHASYRLSNRQHWVTTDLYWISWHLYREEMRNMLVPCLDTRIRFLSPARSKLMLCSANHRAGNFSNLACDWLRIVWAYSEQETENGNGPRGGNVSRKEIHARLRVISLRYCCHSL